MKVILLNGAPRSGKSTSAKMLRGILGDRCAIIGMSYHLKRMTHGVYLGRDGWDMDPDAFDGCKSDPQALLDGMSWRQIYIHYSEQVIKPLHGKEWFGEQFVRSARASGANMVVVPDNGFVQEAERTVREFGAENVRLCRIYKDGCNFEGDSRGYISLRHLGVVENEITNVHGQPQIMRDQMERLATVWA
jgi:hypothetical protein